MKSRDPREYAVGGLKGSFFIRVVISVKACGHSADQVRVLPSGSPHAWLFPPNSLYQCQTLIALGHFADIEVAFKCGLEETGAQA